MRAAQDKAFYFEIHPSDDAKANERFVAAVQTVQTATSSRSRDGDNRQSCEQCRCCSHQNHLGLLDVVAAVFGLKLANALYCTSMFFRMGSYYGRCTLELHRYLAFEDRVRFYPGVQVPDEDMALSKSILAYLKDTALFREHDLLSGRKTGGLCKQMAKLLSVWTGGYKKSGTFCLYGCRADTREEAILDLKEGLHSTVLSRAPPCAEMGKWTKIGLALDWYPAALLNNWFRDLLQHALAGSMGKKANLDESLEDVLKTFDSSFVQDVSYQRVAGKRFQGVFTDFSCKAHFPEHFPTLNKHFDVVCAFMIPPALVLV